MTIIIYLTIINYYLCYLTLIMLISVLNGPNFYVTQDYVKQDEYVKINTKNVTFLHNLETTCKSIILQ